MRNLASRAEAAVGNARFTTANATALSVVLAVEGFGRIGPWVAVSGQ